MTLITFDEHIGIIEAIKGLQLCRVTSQRVKITIQICSSKPINSQGSNAGSLFKIAHQDITTTHQNKLFKMSESA